MGKKSNTKYKSSIFLREDQISSKPAFPDWTQ